MPANVENSAVATGPEKVSFHSNLKKGNAMNVQTTTKLHSSHTLAKYVQNSPSQALSQECKDSLISANQSM